MHLTELAREYGDKPAVIMGGVRRDPVLRRA